MLLTGFTVLWQSLLIQQVGSLKLFCIYFILILYSDFILILYIFYTYVYEMDRQRQIQTHMRMYIDRIVQRYIHTYTYTYTYIFIYTLLLQNRKLPLKETYLCGFTGIVNPNYYCACSEIHFILFFKTWLSGKSQQCVLSLQKVICALVS